MPNNLVDKLRAAIARTTNKGSLFQCNAILFEIASYGPDLDPHVHILIRRVTALRRFLAKFPFARTTVDRCINAYHAMGFVGTNRDELDFRGNETASRLPT